MSDRNAPFTIGALASATGTRAGTIRYYEREELLRSAARSSAGYRLYTSHECDRLLFIRRARALGFSLEDIRALLALADRREVSCAAVDAKVEQQLEEVRRRLRDLRALERELTQLSTCCEGGIIKECKIIGALSEGA